MRNDIVYRVYGLHAGRDKDFFWNAYRTRAEAESEIAKLLASEMNGRNWAEQYHNRGFVIRETAVETDFEIPAGTKPRDRYYVSGLPKQNRPGTWDSTLVEVFRRVADGGEPKKVCEYVRNYGLLQTFEPFRQGNREFALVAPEYTGTSVLDLSTGQVIAKEPPSEWGFCPVGFYVPDWWDVNDGHVIPGSEYWNSDKEWPGGEFGFVWGCVWGDDSSWKVQLLNLSGIQRGEIHREERFGYVELATDGYESPCFQRDWTAPPRGSNPPPFIRLEHYEGQTRVTFAVEMQFDFFAGQAVEWQRVKNLGLD